MEDGPTVHKLDGEEDDEEKSSVSDEVEEEYPDDVDNPSDVEADVPEGESEGEEVDLDASEYGKDDDEKSLMGKLELGHKMDSESDFSKVTTGDLILLDTPLEGAKVGEVKSVGETWTGVTECKADTGARQYTVTPFDDEFSTTYLGTVGEQMELQEKVLAKLKPVTMDGLESGKRVCMDVPHIGPTSATVTDVVKTPEQGRRVTLKSGEVHFVVYEEPGPDTVKEQPYIVGELMSENE